MIGKKIESPSHMIDWKKLIQSIDLNVLYVPHNSEEIRNAYKSKHNLNCENQVIVLMITDNKK